MKKFETQLAHLELDVDAPVTPVQLESVDLELVSGGSVATFLAGLIYWWVLRGL